MVGLWERRDTLVATFSGGMRRRLEIARGLMHSPRVLFLDEPTIGLDPQTRSSIWSYIRELQQAEEITIFMTTHYMDEAEFCDRIAIMDHGEIVALDTPGALKACDRRGPRAHPDRRRRRRDRRAGGAIARRGARVEGAVTFAVEQGEAFVPRLFARTRRSDQLGERVAADAGRRLHVLHGHDDPRRRGIGGQRGRDRDGDARDDGSAAMSALDKPAAERHPRSRPGPQRARGAAGHQDRLAARADPLLQRPAADRHLARAAAPVPVRARERASRLPSAGTGGCRCGRSSIPASSRWPSCSRRCSRRRRSSGIVSSASCAR